MKKIFKKNQIIITSLAALIAVAGYLNHIENNEKKLDAVNVAGTKDETTTADENTSNISPGNVAANGGADASKDIESNDLDITGEPGEAVFVNAVGTVDFVVEAKLLREQTRANSKTMLMEIVNNVNAGESEKQAAINKITELADVADREMAAENLIAAKGYENVVVTVTDGAADVMIVSENLSDAARAQIEEIVKTKTNVPADKITITAVKTN